MIDNFSYACTLLIDTVIYPHEVSGKIIPLSTKLYDKYILQNVVANTYNSFYTIKEPNNIITIERESASLEIETQKGFFYYKENIASEHFFQSPTEYTDSMFAKTFGGEGTSPGKFSWATYTTTGEGNQQKIVYYPRDDHTRLSMGDSYPIILNEPQILDFQSQGGYLTMVITSKEQNPTYTNQLIRNEINAWNKENRLIDAPYYNMSYRNALKRNDDSVLLPSTFKQFAFLSGITCRNLLSIPDPRPLPAYFLMGSFWYCTHEIDIPSPYDTINLEFINQNDIRAQYSFCAFYDENFEYLFWVYPQTLMSGKNAIGYYFTAKDSQYKDKIKHCCILFYSSQDLITNPTYKDRITKSYFTSSSSKVDIIITPGFYAGTEDLEGIYKLVVDGFKQDGVDVTISYNKNTGKVLIKSEDTGMKRISFKPGLNRIFGEYDSDEIHFTTEYKSPHIADLFSNGKFNAIKIHCPQINNSSFVGMSDVICQIYPANNFGEQIVSQNINFYVNFPDHVNLSSLTLIVTDNNNQLLELMEPVYLIFQIFCYVKKETELPNSTVGSSVCGTRRNFY